MESVSVPEGFTRVSLGKGWGTAFGWLYVDQTRNRIGFWVREQHANPVDGLHGGAMATFADMQLIAFNRKSGPDKHPTISLSLDFVARVPIGTWVEAQVSIIRTTRNMIFTSAIVTADGNPVARINAIYRNIPS